MADKTIKSFRYRIYPTKRQVQTLESHLAICCELYNAALQERREGWKIEQARINYFSQSAQLGPIRADRIDVGDVSSHALENVLRRVDLAFQSFFRRCRNGDKPGYPRFRSSRRYNSLTFRQVGQPLRKNKLRLPKMGSIKIRVRPGQEIQGTIKTLTIKREARHWFAIFACEIERPEPLPFSAEMIGVDVGLTAFATLSDGTEIENPRYYRKAERKLRVAQRRVARRKKGSKRRRNAVVILQTIHALIHSQRRDFHHNISRQLVNRYGLIAVEGLNVKGLASGMLAKSVNDAGWSSFIDKIAYKAENAGRTLVKVDPRGTSQTCTCGASVPKTLRQRWHECSSCGLSARRDHVSALVILQRAVSLSGANVEVFDSCVA